MFVVTYILKYILKKYLLVLTRHLCRLGKWSVRIGSLATTSELAVNLLGAALFRTSTLSVCLRKQG